MAPVKCREPTMLVHWSSRRTCASSSEATTRTPPNDVHSVSRVHRSPRKPAGHVHECEVIFPLSSGYEMHVPPLAHVLDEQSPMNSVQFCPVRVCVHMHVYVVGERSTHVPPPWQGECAVHSGTRSSHDLPVKSTLHLQE